ncbi:MAG: hypothetical protein KatS3mg040_0370 [Candidatus Kapaibacterium sp.]|nr:MAG: hypothetical protein KatS3mg040_0370 [Candidatus Kapabacteria bacterium]
MKHVVAYLAVVLIAAAAADAQNYLPKGSIFGGIRIGIGAKESAFNVALDGEYTLTDLGEAGPGIVNLGVSIDYSRFSKVVTQGNVSSTQTTTYVPITLAGIYHFSPSIEDMPQLDPYILAGFAYRVYTVSSDLGYGVIDTRSNNEVILVGGIGAWYFFTPQIAGHLRLAFGASTATIGIVYRFR